MMESFMFSLFFVGFYLFNLTVNVAIYYSLGSMMLLMIMMMFNFSEFFFLGGLGVYIDSMGNSLGVLSIWISLLMILSSYKIMKKNEGGKVFIFLVVFLMIMLLLTFYVGDYLMFYFFFEVTLIPTLLIIMGWGYQPERLQAGIYFIFYTLTASLPLLLIIIYFYFDSSLMYFWFGFSSTTLEVLDFKGLVSFMFMAAFLIKLPMYLTHLWLPKAHVEAPVAGSMILAGVLLKLGGYGLMRVYCLISSFYLIMGPYLIGLSLFGMLYIGFICCRLNDFKALVAYSSVAHMGMVICGCVCMFSWGFEGGLLMMIGHGVSSSGLFCVVNMYYERLGSRSFYINKGLMLIFPIFTLMIFMLAAANIAAPPSINLISEIFLMSSIMGFDLLMLLVFPMGSFLGAIFTIYMFSFSQHGKIYFMNYGVSFSSFREMHLLSLHIIPLNIIFLNPSLFILL